jgi:hypothetical protein
LYLARHDHPNARAAFTQALTLDPTSPDALAGLVVLDLGALTPDPQLSTAAEARRTLVERQVS